jgi:hypothetical protein
MYALNWLTGLRGNFFKIMSCDPDLHPRWPPSADIVLTWGPMGKMFSLKQTWHEWSLGGQLSKLCPVTPTFIQDGRHQQT